MNWFPYGFSKEELYKSLSNVKNLEYFAFIVLPLIIFNALVYSVHAIKFKISKKYAEATSLSPLISKFYEMNEKVMGLIHIICFLNVVCHLFHFGWLVSWLWYPMWITAYIIKVFSEMYIIVISLFSISRYFVHFSLAKPSVELTQTCVKTGMRVISSWMILKDLVLFFWLIVTLEQKKYKQTDRIVDYYYAIHLSHQLLLFLSAFLQLPIMCSSQKSEHEPSCQERLIYNQTVGIAFAKLILIPPSIFLASRGVNDGVLSAIFVAVDLFLVPIAVQLSELLYKPKVQPSTEFKMGPL